MTFRWSVVATLAILTTGSCQRAAPPPPAKAAGPVKVRTAAVTAREIRRVVESVGTLFPYDEVIISAEIDGRVGKVNFDLGDAVRAGDVLVQISDEEQRYVVAQNEAQLRQSLERLGLTSENEKVKDIDQTPEVRRALADLNEAQKRFQRLRSLVDQKIGAQADLDAASSRYQSAQAAVDVVRNQTRNLIQEVERFKATLELQRKKLRDTSVRSPFAAEVKERVVTTGQFVRTNTPLFTLVQTNPVRLRIEVPERMAPWTQVGQTAIVTVEAYADREFQGRVSRISPTVDQSKRTFVVEALIDNPGHALKPGSYARARLATQKVDSVLLVPARGVNYVLGSNKAYIVKDGKIEARDVKTGDRYGEMLEIAEGLALGDQIAVTQLNRLDTGVPIQIDNSAPAQRAGPGSGSGAAE